jgi:hypothetical protein
MTRHPQNGEHKQGRQLMQRIISRTHGSSSSNNNNNNIAERMAEGEKEATAS